MLLCITDTLYIQSGGQKRLRQTCIHTTVHDQTNKQTNKKSCTSGTAPSSIDTKPVSAPTRDLSATLQHNHVMRRDMTRHGIRPDCCTHRWLHPVPIVFRQVVTWYEVEGLRRGLSSLATVGGPSKMHSRDSTYREGARMDLSLLHNTAQQQTFRRAHSLDLDRRRSLEKQNVRLR